MLIISFFKFIFWIFWKKWYAVDKVFICEIFKFLIKFVPELKGWFVMWIKYAHRSNSDGFVNDIMNESAARLKLPCNNCRDVGTILTIYLVFCWSTNSNACNREVFIRCAKIPCNRLLFQLYETWLSNEISLLLQDLLSCLFENLVIALFISFTVRFFRGCILGGKWSWYSTEQACISYKKAICAENCVNSIS